MMAKRPFLQCDESGFTGDIYATLDSLIHLDLLPDYKDRFPLSSVHDSRKLNILSVAVGLTIVSEGGPPMLKEEYIMGDQEKKNQMFEIFKKLCIANIGTAILSKREQPMLTEHTSPSTLLLSRTKASSSPRTQRRRHPFQPEASRLAQELE